MTEPENCDLIECALGDTFKNEHNLLVDEECSLRLDQFITKKLPELARSQTRKLLESGCVFLNDQLTSKGSRKLRAGDRIRIIFPENRNRPLELEAEDIALDIVYEDESLLVVNKAQGMITHPGAGVFRGTLVNALLHHCRGNLAGIGGVERPGIVHRLDKDTAGLLVVAKNDSAHRALSEQIASRLVKRQYLALLHGFLPQPDCRVEKPLGRHPIDRKKMAIVLKGKEAITNFKTIERFKTYSLVEARLETGRTHQIRVHAASLDSPVVGDLVYNNKGSGTETQRAKLGLSGHCLYAVRLALTHPATQELLEFVVQPPEELESLLSRLRSA